MSVIVVGLNHRTVPLEVLERMTVSDAHLPKALPWFLAAGRNALPDRVRKITAARAALGLRAVSDFDTLLGVYTGSAVNALTEIASNDDNGGPQSKVQFSAVAGTTYYIAVDGRSAAQGNISLALVAGTLVTVTATDPD